MSFVHGTIVRNSSSHFDEHRWVIQIQKTLDEELEEDTEIPVSIFNIPKTLMIQYPDCYIPQEIAFGPYHCYRPELYEMQRYKVAAAKRIQKQLKNIKFHDLVKELSKMETKVRAYYHKYLNFNGETLAWMMAVDASFLLEFLQIYIVREGTALTRVSSGMSHLLDVAGVKSAHNAILRDMVMLENQIPIFLLRKVLELLFSSVDLADQILISMLMGFCKEISPFKLVKELSKFHVTERAHLLDFVYHALVPRLDEKIEVGELVLDGDDQNEVKQRESESDEGSTFGDPSYIRKILNEIWNILSKLNFVRRVLFSTPVKVIAKLAWKIISQLPIFKLLKQAIESLFRQGKGDESKVEDESSDSNKPPLVEEISIPSVTELSKAGVSFSPTTKGTILDITFDAAKATLYLPTISLEANTEVILRNLVAYEACNASGPLIFTRYTELMNGIVDTEEDVKLLRERGIVLNRLKSDQEVADLWNGMNKSVRLSKVPPLDKAIEDVNKFYNGTWKVKVRKFTELYVFGSWKFLTLLAAVLLFFLLILQSFCSVYSCSRIIHVKYIP